MSSTFVFIDAAIDDAALLASGVCSEATVILLDSAQDGVAQISTVLATQDQLENVHIFSHGAPGTLQLGSSLLSLDSIDSYDLAPWQQALRHANLLIYGCRVAAGETGDRFLHALHQRTGANIAATATPTGNATQGGDWNLERRIGAIEPTPILHPDVMAQYSSTLQVGPNVNANFLYGASLATVNGNNVSQLYRINLSNGNAALVDGVTPLDFPTFAIARDSSTGDVYYIGTQSNGSAPIAFVNPETRVRFVSPTPTNQPVLFVKLAQKFDGDIYAMDGSTPTLYIIDLDANGNPSSIGAPQTITPSDGIPLLGGGGDIAFDPSPANRDRLFTIVTNPNDNNPGLPTNLYRLYTINTTNFTSNFIGDVRLANGEVLNDAGSGSLAFVNGALYLTARGTDGINRLYRVNSNTAIVEGNGIAIQGNLEFNDFATLPITVNNPSEDTPPPGTVPTDPGDGPDTGNENGDNCVDSYDRTGRRNRNNRLTGDDGSNRLTGANRNDFIYGFGCNDTLVGLQGRDLLRGGDGRDFLRGNQGDDTLNGGRGNDTLEGGLNDDRLVGGRGTDVLGGGKGEDVLLGEDGNDRLSGNAGDDLLEGGSGDDALFGRLNSDTLRGGDGNDLLNGNLNNDRLEGDAGDDRLDGGRGNDTLEGGSGNDTLFGRLEEDVLNGEEGDDVLNGGANNDILRGGSGRDRLLGRGGADLLVGGNQGDFIDGSAGFDRLLGEGGNDRLFGGRLADQISTGGGDDLIEYRGFGDQGDVISDFSVRDDQIDFSRLFRGNGYGSNRAFRDYVRIERSGSDTTISVDVNGDRRGGFEEFLTLSGVRANSVSGRNFIV